MKKDFTSRQKEIVARKLGYEGPMQGFDEFVASSPALSAKYNMVTQKYVERMAKGGLTRKRKKYAAGGATDFGLQLDKDEQKKMEETNASSGVAGVGGVTQVRPTQDKQKEAAPPANVVNPYWMDPANKPILKDVIGALKISQGTGDYDVKYDVNNDGKITESDVIQLQKWSLGVDNPTNYYDKLVQNAATAAADAQKTDQTSTRTMGTTFTDIGGVPMAGGAAQLTAEQLKEDPSQLMSTTEGLADATATQATASQAGAAETAKAPDAITASTVGAAASTPSVKEAMKGVEAAKGTVSDEAQVTAVTMDPTSTAVGDLQAAQLKESQKVQAPPARKVEAGEMISGTGVDMTRAEQLARQTEAAAAQGTVTDEMTVQGQLNKVLADFDAGNPPPWAAASMRAATAQMAARGIGASSMAGQAIIQSAMEAAVPIASQDAKVFQEMGMQNLSNRQQTAVLAAQQRAAFLGQEFDQTFQMKVANAAKISDIANMNFTASQQIALENARMAQSVDLANLSNRQALVMAEAAQIATLETTNLNNRQQAQVANAQAFLQMDMANLDNEQQTTLFKAQQITNSLLSDTAAENAARQFNATSQNQTNQFMSSLTAQVNQFNVAQKNALEQFNVDQANAIAKINTEAQNARDQFNATQRLVIDQSNAQWRRDISTANTTAINTANYLNAQNVQQLTLAEYNNETQLYRDQIQQTWDSYERDQDRIVDLAKATIAANAEKDASQTTTEASMWTALGELIAKW